MIHKRDTTRTGISNARMSRSEAVSLAHYATETPLEISDERETIARDHPYNTQTKNKKQYKIK